MKIKEVAAEYKMTGKAVLEKAQSMGIKVSKISDELSEIDEKAVRNTINKNNTVTETKVVKIKAKKGEADKKDEEAKVEVKAANIKLPEIKKQTVTSTEGTARTAKPPIGKPIISKEIENRKSPLSKSMPVEKIEKVDNVEETKDKATFKKEIKSQEKEMTVTIKKEESSMKSEQTSKKVEKEETVNRVEAPRPVSRLKVIKKAADVRKEEEERQKARKEAIEREKAQNEKTAQSDRPKKRYNDDRRPQRSGDDRRPQRSGDDRRPQRSGDDRRPQRSGDDRRPQRSGDDRRPQRPTDDRKPQRSGDDRRPQRSGDDRRPQRPTDDRKPQRRDDSDKEVLVTKTTSHRGDKKTKDKERDKFAKLERGVKKPNKQAPYSLEKKTRNKKMNKPKPVPEVEIEVEELPVGTVSINVPITVAGFAEQTQTTVSQIIMTLMKMGVMANMNQNLDEETVVLLAEEMKIDIVIGKIKEEAIEEGIEIYEDKQEDLKHRSPIITVMGHVDHGKTSLLDAIRKTNVTEKESGGITQHIGASEVEINGQKIVFLDTPGHEAFTAMRARGAHSTDIAILVVAADDSVKPQTIESINHAKAAGVPIIVAINKMDKPGANPDVVKKDLSEKGVLVEEWGGDVISVPVSAKTGEGIVNLLEMILLQAEVLELKANPKRLALGTVLEARLDKSKGPVASLLVLNGTLRSGMSIVAGTASGKIRLMTNDKGEKLKTSGPATAVEILGLTEVPQAGDVFNAVNDEKTARDIAEKRQEKVREEVMARNSSTTLEELFKNIEEGTAKELNLIIKGDVQGSVGAIVTSLEKLSNEEVKVKVVHTGVGTVNESDIMLAGTSGAIIIGFNVRPSAAITNAAEREGIQIRTYRVIYDIIDDIENAMKGMLDPEYKEVVLGSVEIREVFKVPGVGNIGGAYVTDGKVMRNEQIRLVRDGIVIHEGKISSLKRFKDDAKEVAQGFECGIGIENYNDVKEGDVIECFTMEEIKRD